MKKIILSLAISLVAIPQMSAMDGSPSASSSTTSTVTSKNFWVKAKEKYNSLSPDEKSGLTTAGLTVGMYGTIALAVYGIIKLEGYYLNKTTIAAYKSFKANSQLLAPVYDCIKKTAFPKDQQLSATELATFLQELLSTISGLIEPSRTSISPTFKNPLDELKYYITALELSITALSGYRACDNYDVLKEMLGNGTVDPKIYVTMELNEATSVKYVLQNFCALCEKRLTKQTI